MSKTGQMYHDELEKCYGVIQELTEALQDIVTTAQAASQSSPHMFCEWAFNRAVMAIERVKP